jgi:hypothetical protein
MGYNIGINVIETNGTASAAIAGAPTSVAGIILRSTRGPTTAATQVTSFSQFSAAFGAYDSRYVGAYGVQGFFQNSGQQAYVVRVAGPGAQAASVTLDGRSGSASLLVKAGAYGVADVGTWGNGLFVTVTDNPAFSSILATTLQGNKPARLQGTAIGALDLSAAPATLTLVIDGAKTFVVALDATLLPAVTHVVAADIVAAINTVAGAAVVASVSAGGVLIVSRTKGAASEVSITVAAGDTIPATVGFAAGNTSATGAATAAAAYNVVQVASFQGFQIGAWVRLDDGITETWFQITGLVTQTSGTGAKQYMVQFAQPAAALQNEYRIEDLSTLSTCEFNLAVSLQGPNDIIPQSVETWEGLSLDPANAQYAPQIVNDPYAGSSYILLTNLAAGAFNPASVPPAGIAYQLGLPTPATTALTRVAGADGAAPSTSDYTAALTLFDTQQIQLLVVLDEMPDAMLSVVSQSAIDYCAGPTRGDCMYVGHTPKGQDQAGGKAFGQALRASKVYGALYWPWITVVDPAGSGSNPTRVIPPSGHVIGVYARTDQTRGVWKAPAGNDAVLRGALAVERDITDIDHTDLVKNGSVNGIRRIPGAGIVVDASRTLSTDSRWLFVNVRLLFNYVKVSLRDGLRWVKQEPNQQTLWNQIKYNTVTPFLNRLYQAGAFGPGKASDVFTVICGAENNPPQQVVLGNLTVEVYFFPSRPAETILIVIGQQDSAASASES